MSEFIVYYFQKRFLLGTTGSTLEDAIQIVLGKLLTDDMMVKFSLDGKRGKRSFKSEFSSVYDAVAGIKLKRFLFLLDCKPSQ